MKGFIKKIISNKRGIAIELAIFVMLVVVSLSALLVSVSLLSKNTTNTFSQNLSARLCLDQIGQSYVSAVKDGEDLEEWSQGISGYTVQVSSTELTLVDSQGKVKLSVKLENTNPNGYRITEWKYS